MGWKDLIETATPESPENSGWRALLPSADPQGLSFFQTIQLANAAHFPEIANRSRIPVLPALREAIEKANQPWEAPPMEPWQYELMSKVGAQEPGDTATAPDVPVGQEPLTGLRAGASMLHSLIPAATPFGSLQSGIRAGGDITRRLLTETGIDEVGAGDILSQELGQMGEEQKVLWTSPYSPSTPLESYVHTLNRFVYGTPRPTAEGIRQNLFERSFITLLGVGGDLLLDPLYLIGRVGQLGTAGGELYKVGKTLDELGIARTSAARNIEHITWYESELGRSIIGEIGSPQRLLMERIDKQLGTLFIPTTPAQQARMGVRGLFNVPVFRTTPAPTFWAKMVQTPIRQMTGRQVNVPALHWEPVGAKMLAPALDILEKKFGVTDSWTLMDMLSFSGRSAEDRAMLGFLKQEIEGGQRLAIRGIREAQFIQAKTTAEIQNDLTKLARQLWDANGGKTGTGQTIDEFFREMVVTINKYSEQTSVMRDVSAGSLTPTVANVDDFPTASTTADPLAFTDLERFGHPEVRKYIEWVRGEQEPRQAAARAIGLRTVDLEHPETLASLSDDQVTAYVAHMATPEAKTWLRQQATDRGKNLVVSASRREIDAWSNTLRTRKARGTLEGYNQWFKEKHDVGWDFFEPNPAIREPAREFENQRRIMSGRFYNNLAERLYNHESGIYKAPLIGEPTQPGWLRLSEMMSERSLKAFDEATQEFFHSVQLPAELKSSFQRQAALIESPEALNAFLDHMMHVTNWWKSNTLGIWPAYHSGNFISNIYLNWLGGMWDPLMYPLAMKVQTGVDGVVKSWWNGREYSYEELRQLVAAYGVRNGFVRGNIERAGQFQGFKNEVGGDYDRPFGWFTAATGIDGRIKGRTAGQVIAGLLPGGQEAILNRVGFAVSGRIEEMNRSAMFFHGLLNEGMAPEQSAAWTLSAMFDYSKFTREQQIASTAFPFYEFALQNTIFHLKSAASYPARIALSPRLIELTIPAIKDQKVDYSALPGYMQRSGVLPINSDQVIDITRFIPFYDAYQNLSRELPREVVSHINPAVDLLASWFVKAEGDKIVGLDMPIGLGGEAGGWDWFRGKPLAEFPGHQELYDITPGISVELDPRTEYFFSTLFRAWGEAKRWDLMRTALGVRLVNQNKATAIHYNLKENRDEMETLQSHYRTVMRGYKPTSDEQIRERSLALLNATLNRTELLASQYTDGNLPFDEGIIPAYSHDAQAVTQYRILHDIGNLLVGTDGHPEYGALYLSSTVGDRKLQSELWRSYAENVQQQAQTLTTYAETMPHTKDGVGEMLDLYGTALDVVERAIDVPGSGIIWKAAHYNLWLSILEQVAGTPGIDAASRAENFASRHMDVYRFWITGLKSQEKGDE